MTILGIDFGNTYSRCAVFLEGKAILIPNAFGEYLTPSVVALNQEKEIIVGKIANDYYTANKLNGIGNFKRFLGSDKEFKLGSETFHAEDLTALILKSLRADAEKYLDQPIDQVILTVPAYFNNSQRNALQIAADIAGLEVLTIVTEATAAATAYGIDQTPNASQYLIFDLRSSSFDLSLVSTLKDQITVRSCVVDVVYGASDFTDQIIKDFVQRLELVLDRSLYNNLAQIAERCKLHLSKNPNDHFKINLNYQGEELSHTYTAQDLEQIYAPVIEKLTQPVKQAVYDGRIKPETLDKLIFVGGGAKLPIFSKIFTKIFKKLPFVYFDPQEVVAIGAALLSHKYAEGHDLAEQLLKDVAPYSLGISCLMAGNSTSFLEFSPVIERNTLLPVSRSRTYYVNPDKDELKINIYCGESRDPINDVEIGSLSVERNFTKDEEQAIEVRFTYDIHGILEVEATVNDNTSAKIIKESCSQLSDDEIRTALAKISNIKIHPREEEINSAIIAQAERIFEEQLGQAREDISYGIRCLLSAMESQDSPTIEDARNQLYEIIDEYSE